MAATLTITGVVENQDGITVTYTRSDTGATLDVAVAPTGTQAGDHAAVVQALQQVKQSINLQANLATSLVGTTI